MWLVNVAYLFFLSPLNATILEPTRAEASEGAVET
jgi:hypothetical protein